MPKTIELTLGDRILINDAVIRYLTNRHNSTEAIGMYAAIHNHEGLNEMALRIAEIVAGRLEASL